MGGVSAKKENFGDKNYYTQLKFFKGQKMETAITIICVCVGIMIMASIVRSILK